MKFPSIAGAQRVQTLLLLTALVAVLFGCLLFTDLVRNFRSTVIADAHKSLANAVTELAQAEEGSTSTSDDALKAVSYEVLRSYPDVEGGYYLNGQAIGQSFPRYTEPGSGLKQPRNEREAVEAALAESRGTRSVAQREFDDGRDLVVVAALVTPERPLAAWGLKRYLNFHDPWQLRHELLLSGLLLVTLVSIGAGLSLSFRLQKGFGAIQAGLARLRTDPDYRLPDQDHELRRIAHAINEMGDSRQRLEADLRREDRLRVMGRVVAGIAHEIRNPLNSLRLTIQVLERRLRGQREAAETVPLVLAEVDRLDKLLEGLLVFRSEEAGRLRLQPVRPVLERTLALVRPQMRDRDIATELDAPEAIVAMVDGDQLQQAVMNLLLNAIDAAGPGGHVTVSLRQSGEQAEINVRDSGPGLSTEQREHMFEAFYTTKSVGTGLGLAVTRTLLHKMGATVHYLEADAGAHFRILLSQVERN
ncbi:MAG TPA: ATP-binding protein [Bryobacteraceae bacterium]|nr:ATP-binding protein [Bryobacteraceae bacterium]